MSDREEKQSRERDLWREVLFRAVADAELEPSQDVIGGRVASDVRDARDYLIRPSKDLGLVCSNAGLDMQAVIEAVNRRLALAATIDLNFRPDQTGLSKGHCRTGRRGRRGRTITHNGETLTIPEWSKRTGLGMPVIYARISKGWPVDSVLNPIALLGRRAKLPEA
ncbi:hypothetical protein [Cypionkella psychrotolerans]|uniref:hypothetical protein n=1 Tax=Cypionkella psychrotolerans TaxID=1678131 RepID=UPI0006B429C3|nr:hypothetical protein [Cypionkella psychrotolerans]